MVNKNNVTNIPINEEMNCSTLEFKSNEKYKLGISFSINSFNNKVIKSSILNDNLEYNFDTIEHERMKAVKSFILEILTDLKDEKLIIDKNNRPIINKWTEYIKDFKDYGRESVETNELYKFLISNKGTFIKMLQDYNNRYLLLEDEKLSPNAISLHSKESELILKHIEDIILQEKNGASIAIIDSHELFKILSERLPNEFECYYVRLSEVLNDTKYNLEDKYINITSISGDKVSKYDYIIMLNNIHNYEEPETVICFLEKLLKKGGKLITSDFDKMNSMALLFGIFYNLNNLDIKNDVRNEFFYKREHILTIFQKIFTETKLNVIGEHHSYLLEGFCNYDYKKIITDISKDIDLDMEDISILCNDIDVEQIMHICSCSEQLKKNELINKDEEFLTAYDHEKKLKEIWELNLKNTNLDLYNKNYFELGGDSLSATKLLIEINDAFNCNISMKDIFENLIFEDMLELINRLADSQESVIYGEI